MSDENRPTVGRVEPVRDEKSFLESFAAMQSDAIEERDRRIARLEAENKRLRGELRNAAAYITKQVECPPSDGCGRCDGHRAKAERYRRAANAVKEGE